MAEIRGIRDADVDTVVDLWTRCGLVVPWNDPHRDIASARSIDNADILVATDADERVLATAMVGYDGHRGWIYYVAVDPEARGTGLGRRIMATAEDWMRARGVPKAELMIRRSNDAVQGFYQALGWTEEPVTVRSRRFDDGPPLGLGTVTTRVTALEMLERPVRPEIHPPAGLTIALIRAHEPPAAFVRWLYERIGADWTWVQRRLKTDDELAAIVRDPAVEVYVLYVAGVPAGYAEIDRRVGADAVELAYFGLMPEFIGRGLGRYFLAEIVDLAWTVGPCERLWVHTCDLDHPRALGGYQRAGFVPFRQFDEVLPDPRLAGLPLPVRPAAGAATPGDPEVVVPLRP